MLSMYLSVMLLDCKRCCALSSLLLAWPQVHASGTGVLQKLTRVLKEKAQQDYDRVFQGTSKTREKLGVRYSLCIEHRRPQTVRV